MRLPGDCRLVGNVSFSSHFTSRTPCRCAGDFCETARARGSLLPLGGDGRMAGDSESVLPPPTEERPTAADEGFTVGFGRVCQRASSGDDIRWDGNQMEKGSEETEGVGMKRPPNEDVGVPRTVLYREVSFRAGASVVLIMLSGSHPQGGRRDSNPPPAPSAAGSRMNRGTNSRIGRRAPFGPAISTHQPTHNGYPFGPGFAAERLERHEPGTRAGCWERSRDS